MTAIKSILAITAVAFSLGSQAQNLASVFGAVKPAAADLQLTVNGHGSGGAYLSVKEFGGKQVTGEFNSGFFADKPIGFSAVVDGNTLKIKTAQGHNIQADLKKQEDGSFTGNFSGDFSGTAKLVLK
jgi:hypothetical protein